MKRVDRSAWVDGLGRLTAVVLLLAAEWGPAQAYVEVVKAGDGKSTIDIGGLAAGPGREGLEFTKTLERDLVRSGWFTVLSGGAGSVSLRGTFSSQGGASVRCEAVSPGDGRVFARSRLSEPAGARRLAHLLADEIVRGVKGVRGIASTRIAMIGAQGARRDLYVCDYDGANLVRITNQGAICLSPHWWPDGKALAYTSFHGGFPDLYRIDLAESRRTRLVAFPGLNTGGAISPDGRSMALILSKEGNPEMYVMNLRSRGLTRMTRTPRAAEASPSWSPDGRQLAFVSDRSGSPQIYVLDAGNATPKRISFRGTENVGPDWGPDGRIAFSSRREGRYQICVFDPTTGRTDQLTSQSVDHEDPSWAANGRHIVYARTVNYRSELYVLDTMGDPPVRLSTMAGDWYSPAWSVR